MTELLFRHTTHLWGNSGEALVEPAWLFTVKSGKMEGVGTPYGTVRVKTSSGYGVCRSKMEYEDLAKIAREQGLSLEDVRSAVRKAEYKNE